MNRSRKVLVLVLLLACGAARAGDDPERTALRQAISDQARDAVRTLAQAGADAAVRASRIRVPSATAGARSTSAERAG